jgi:hypothetical protein
MVSSSAPCGNQNHNRHLIILQYVAELRRLLIALAMLLIALSGIVVPLALPA